MATQKDVQPTQSPSPFAAYYGAEPVSKRAQQEEATLAFWKEGRMFERSLERPSPKGEFVFYEGPPTANGRPGIHHLVARAFKDLILRYRTMRGYHVRRKAGWDTHGLPVEVEVEKKLGIKTKRDVEAFGIERFNELCKQSVWEYAREWEHFTERIGYWIDLENAYVTYHPEYIESLWWVVQELHNRGLLYKDYKVVPWCPRCGTPLSSHELAQEYRDVEDRALYVRFAVEGQEATYLLAWTTTPWTLPGNVALAVHPELRYAKVRASDGAAYWVARDRVAALFGEEATVEEEVTGEKLVGLRYAPLWQGVPLLWKEEERERALRVYPAEFVSAEEGTGIVHTAVMYGQEDFELGVRYKLPRRHLVAEDGTFIPEEALGPLGGKFVKDPETEELIVAHLRERGALWKEETVTHAYPFCWRCKQRVLYYAHTSWFVRMSALRDELLKENQTIHWEPEHLRDGRFGEWLANVKDWAISRNRFWGTPLPVWENERGERMVVGSIAQLRAHTPSRGNQFWLMRHGQARSNEEGFVDDGRDPANTLTPQGREAVRRAAQALKGAGITRIYTSPVARAVETAHIVREELGLPQEAVCVEERLREVGVGNLQGASLARWQEVMGPARQRFGAVPEGAEPWEQVRQRVAQALFAIDEAHRNERILIVSHQTPLALLVSAFDARGAEWTRRNYEGLPHLALAEVLEKGEFRPYPHNNAWEIDLHRPYVDAWELIGSDGSVFRRVEEVMDVWFDSGAMPFAQDHYPFENREWVDTTGYPADYICEGVDQTRGWFYTLHAIGVALGRGKAYRNVISVGLVLDKEGKKMSKSLGNIVDPWHMAARYGVDVVRLYMYSVNQPGMPKLFDEAQLKELERNFFNLVENTCNFYSLYRHPDDARLPAGDLSIVDQWLNARTSVLEARVREHLDAFKVFEAARELLAYADDLSRWYVRRSRARMRGLEGDAAHRAASHTLRRALNVFARVAAPFTPFLAERIFAVVRFEDDAESVHLADWPELPKADEELLKRTEAARAIVSEALRQRDEAGIRVRQPLARITLRSDPHGVASDPALAREVCEEVNVLSLEVDPTAPAQVVLDTTITDELRARGWVREAQRLVQEARKRAGLTPQKEASVILAASPEARRVLEEHKEELARVVRARDIEVQEEASLAAEDPPVRVVGVAPVQE